MAVPLRITVIGSGLAGSVAALSAARALPSAHVVVLEKEATLAGNSAKANSGINALAPEQGDSAETFKADTLTSGGGRSRGELVDTLVDGSQAAMHFLQEAGVRFGAVFQTGGQSVKRTHSTPSGDPPVGPAIMAALQRSMQQHSNIEVRSGTKVTELAPAGGGAWHLTVTPASGSGGSTQLLAHAVVIATGGYAASSELLQRYAPYAAGLGTTNGPFASGDGLLLGLHAGAAAVDLDCVQLNPTGIVDPRDPASTTKTVAPEKLRGLGAILVNLEGRRFVNELGRRDEVAQAILRQPQGQGVLLFGAQTAADFGPALQGYINDGLIARAESPVQAAQQAGLPAQQLEAELAAYNQAAAAGCDAFGKTVFPATIDTSQPLYWTRITPVSHYCMGGLAIDAGARVLDAGGRPIPGLFAAGEVAGGVHGANLLVGSSLLECVVFGRVAGEAAAAYVSKL